jgi:hypothetical protein
VDLPLHRDPASAPSAKNHSKDDPELAACTIRRLTQCEAVRIVGAADLTAKRRGKIALQWMPVEPGRIGVLHQTRRFSNSAGDPDTHRAALPNSALNFRNEVPDCSDSQLIIPARAVDPDAFEFSPIAIKRNRFRLGSAQVDSDAQLSPPPGAKPGANGLYSLGTAMVF